MKAIVLVFSIIPGVGHIHTGRCGKGILLFFCFLFFVNGVVMGRILLEEDASRQVAIAGIACASLLWFYSAIDAIRGRNRG